MDRPLRERLHYVFGLTYLAPEVSDAFSFDLAEDMPDNDDRLTTFSDYLVESYIEEDANFPPEIWAHYAADITRTTNCCESSNSKFKKYCAVYHPHIFIFLRTLTHVQTDTYLSCNSIVRNERRLPSNNQIIQSDNG